MEISISDELNSIINFSREEAMRTGCYGIAPDHMFLGIIRHKENAAADALMGVGIDMLEMKQFIDSRIFTNEHIPYSEIDNVTFSRGAQNVLSLTVLEATNVRSANASAQHLLLALCREGSSYGCSYLNDQGIAYGQIYRYLDRNDMMDRDSIDKKNPVKNREQDNDEPQIRIRAVKEGGAEETEQQQSPLEKALAQLSA